MKSVARKRIVDVEEEWGVICSLLPEGWQEKARELGAVRRLRGVGSVETLLRILLMHLVDGCSLKETSLRAAQEGWAQLSAVALLKRLRSAGPCPESITALRVLLRLIRSAACQRRPA